MALEIRQSLKLTQTLIMTQKLQQAIKLLQLTRMELLGEIHQALETNPVLEEQLADERTVEIPEEENWPSFSAETPAEEPKVNGDAKSSAEEWDWDNFLKQQEMPPAYQEYEEREAPTYENLNAQETTLKSHLLWQMRMADLDLEGERIASLIIGNLDNDGYLQVDLEEIAEELKCDPARVEQVLRIVQSLDPPGVAARDLKECLLLQLAALGVKDPLIAAIVEHHLPTLANHNYQVIARDLKVSLEEVAEAAEVISSLDPKPGRQFDAENPAYINPDVFVQKVGDEYIITLNEDGLPKLRVNHFYLEAMRHPENLSEAAKQYIQKHLDSALWFIRSINQRQRTLYKVAESIIRFQRDFLDYGLSQLKPLTLRQVAEDVQMHESTISRVTTGKYIHTPQGLLI